MLMDNVNLGIANLGCLLAVVWTHVARPETVSVGPKMGSFGPLQAETEKRPYLGLDGPNRESVDTFPTSKPPL